MANTEKYIINYKGKTLKTSIQADATPEEIAQVKQEYFAKPPIEEVIKQMRTIARGGVKDDKITRYYFRELMSLVQVKTAKWTVNDIFECPELYKLFKGKVLKSPKTFTSDNTFTANFSKCISLGGKSYAQKPTNFPIKAADEVLAKYNINNNWLDFSCGWGARLTAALKHHVNYFGIDPNDQLVEQLYALCSDWKNNIDDKSSVNIKIQGSETFVPEWENQMGLAFSSPPYFDLEDYKIGNQSYTTGVTFEDWLKNYLYPTFDNIYKYLIDDGILALNIKNIENYPLVDISDAYLKEHSFEYIETMILQNIKRIKSTGIKTDASNEGIYIYRKAKNNER